ARMRPRSLEEFVGQEQIVGEGRLLRRAIAGDTLFSIILWGPPGTGKTTLARIVAETTNAHYEPLSAVSAGIADLRRVVKEAQDRVGMVQQRTVVCSDETHRFNKAREGAVLAKPPALGDRRLITVDDIRDALQSRATRYDKNGELHYDAISALHKCVRDSDPDAALYWLGRMLDGGEDALYIARRVVRMAVEDIGLADPQAPPVTTAAHQAARSPGQ